MEKITIDKKGSKLRLDKFLTRELFLYPRGEIIRQIREGNITVGKKKVKPSYILKESDEVEVDIKKNESQIISNKEIKLDIIYKDDDIIVVNKPYGVRVHPDAKEKFKTLVNTLVWFFPEIEKVGEDAQRPGIVHRLDKDTSGVLVVARNEKAYLELKKKFKDREMEKKYWALVYGGFGAEEKAGVISKPLARSNNYRKQVVAGKKTKTTVRLAETGYRVIKDWGDYALVEVSPKTGRMHQIRVHLTSIGHPIIGDKLYGSKNIKLFSGVARQLLHAKSISFDLFGRKYDFEASEPKDFSEMQKILTNRENKARI